MSNPLKITQEENLDAIPEEQALEIGDVFIALVRYPKGDLYTVCSVNTWGAVSTDRSFPHKKDAVRHARDLRSRIMYDGNRLYDLCREYGKSL